MPLPHRDPDSSQAGRESHPRLYLDRKTSLAALGQLGLHMPQRSR
jgi:hypothetical protein